jgi:hypothetical protein
MNKTGRGKTDVLNIKPDEVEIDGKAWDDSEVQLLVSREILLFDRARDYWEHLLTRGRDLFNKYIGDILTDEQIAAYEDTEEKIVIQPQVMKSPIRALIGQVIKGRRSGQVVTEGMLNGERSEESDIQQKILTVILKHMESTTSEKYKLREAVHDAFVSCYPNVLFFEKAGPSDSPDEGKLKLTHLPWDSCMFGPLTFNESDGSDISELWRFTLRTQAELEELFPDMVDQIRAHVEHGGNKDARQVSSVEQWDGTFSSESRDTLNGIIENSLDGLTIPGGYVQCVEHLYPIKRKQEVWVNVFDSEGNDVVIRPPDWDDNRWQQWVTDNQGKYAGPYEREVKTLWSTVFTLSGMGLNNAQHWFQKSGRGNWSVWIPELINGVPSGPAHEMSDDALANCVAEIEFLDDIRKGGGTLAFIRQGAIVNPETLPEESNKAFGVAVVSDKFNGPVNAAFSTVTRQPSDTWAKWGEHRKQSMYDNTRINETMQGAAAPRQAAIAKELEIGQALIVNAMYIDNFNRSYEKFQNLKLALIPYAYDEPDVLEIFDEDEKGKMQLPINQTEGWDQEGEPETVVNNLTSINALWRINPVDDSPTAKIRYMEEAITILNAASGPLMQADPTGKFFATFLQGLDNPVLKTAGKALEEDAAKNAQGAQQAQQQAEQAKADAVKMKAEADMIRAQKTGLTTTFTGADFATYPKLFELYQTLLAQSKAMGIQPPPAPPQDMGNLNGGEQPAQPSPQMPTQQMEQLAPAMA